MPAVPSFEGPITSSSAVISTRASPRASAALRLVTCSTPLWISASHSDPCVASRMLPTNMSMRSSTRRAAGSSLSRSTRSSLKCMSASRACVRLVRSVRRCARIFECSARVKLVLSAMYTSRADIGLRDHCTYLLNASGAQISNAVAGPKTGPHFPSFRTHDGQSTSPNRCDSGCPRWTTEDLQSSLRREERIRVGEHKIGRRADVANQLRERDPTLKRTTRCLHWVMRPP